MTKLYQVKFRVSPLSLCLPCSLQVEKAKTHYNGKKQQLLEEQEACRTLQAYLETSKSEAKALKAELKLVSMELENIKASEKRLEVEIKSLETQVGEFIPAVYLLVCQVIELK